MIEQWEIMMKSPIDGYTSSKIHVDGIYLASGMKIEKSIKLSYRSFPFGLFLSAGYRKIPP